MTISIEAIRTQAKREGRRCDNWISPETRCGAAMRLVSVNSEYEGQQVEIVWTCPECGDVQTVHQGYFKL